MLNPVQDPVYGDARDHWSAHQYGPAVECFLRLVAGTPSASTNPNPTAGSAVSASAVPAGKPAPVAKQTVSSVSGISVQGMVWCVSA